MINASRSLTIAICVALLIPASVFAEEVTNSTVSSGTTSTTDGTSITLPPVKPLPPKPILNQRNATTSGTKALLQKAPLRVMASGTPPLPKELEERMKEREQKRDCISQTGASSTTTDCIREGMENREERRAEARERMEEKRSEILKHLSEQMFKRMEAAIERYTKLSDRVDSRIQKLKEKGVDTTKSESLVATTRTKIAEAKAAVETARQEVEGAATLADDSASSTKPIDAGKRVRENLEEARVAITAAHKALVSAIESLKASSALRENIKPREESTGTTTSQAQ